MKSVRVPLHGNVAKSVTLDADATDGAVVGVNLRKPDGTLVTLEDLGGGTPGGSNDLTTTDDLDEGGYNFYFTDKRARDAVGGILTDTATIDFTYDPDAPTIKADLKTLADAGGGALVKIARDTYGRVSGTSSATTDDLPEGSAHLYYTDARVDARIAAAGAHAVLPVVTGEVPPVLVYAEDGSLIYTEIS